MLMTTIRSFIVLALKKILKNELFVGGIFQLFLKLCDEH